jgi:ribosome-binding factor A
MSIRTDKVAQALQREVSAVIQRDLHDPHIGFVTVTRVDVSPDLRNAKLYVSVLGGEADVEESIKHLRGALGYIRRRIAPHLDLRYTPVLSIIHDDTGLKAERIENLINELDIDRQDDPEDL